MRTQAGVNQYINTLIAEGVYKSSYADAVWRVNYGPKDYVSRRGGDFIVDVDARDASIKQVLHGQ
ncbi:MAG TPA: hypothetical protein VG324_01795 [Blastocatellia bacterium]|nr:hypothetical protein [Blastocatellia bacterium]